MLDARLAIFYDFLYFKYYTIASSDTLFLNVCMVVGGGFKNKQIWWSALVKTRRWIKLNNEFCFAVFSFVKVVCCGQLPPDCKLIAAKVITGVKYLDHEILTHLQQNIQCFLKIVFFLLETSRLFNCFVFILQCWIYSRL